MKTKSILKWTGITLIFITACLTGTFLYFNHHIDHVLGAHTEVVDISQFSPISDPIAITHANVLSTNADSILANQTVLIRDKKIEAIGADMVVPEGYHVVNANRKFLIPGLVDSHIHLKKSKNDLLLYLANGITHIGEMTGMEHHLDWRQEIKEGALGPGIYIASPKMTSEKNLRATLRSRVEKRHQNFPTVEKARKAVRDFKSLGYDAIKLSSFLTPEIYFAITDEASKQEIDAIGHLSVWLTLEDLYKSEQSQLAHVSEITKALERAFGETKPVYYINTEEYLEYVRAEADGIARKIKEKDMVVVATIWLHETIALQDFDLPNFLKTIELEYMNPGWVEGSAVSRGWLPGNNSYENPENTDPESMRLDALVWDTKVQAEYIIIRALMQQGVKMVTGTDANGADGVIPGFSLHEELRSLSNIGLSNAEILQSATKNAGEWMKQPIGKIEVGYEADLVLLNANPLEDISNTKNINTVITNGQLLTRQDLNRILLSVKEANDRSRKVNINEFIE
jgi:hypothetical protein